MVKYGIWCKGQSGRPAVWWNEWYCNGVEDKPDDAKLFATRAKSQEYCDHVSAEHPDIMYRVKQWVPKNHG
jgi:hypothetical protein